MSTILAYWDKEGAREEQMTLLRQNTLKQLKMGLQQKALFNVVELLAGWVLEHAFCGE